MINIFVIDDHPIVANGIKALFDTEKDNVRVTSWAFTAAQAKKKLTKSKADIVLLDLILPDVSGVELCLYIKEHYPDKKVIVLTAETNPAVLQQVWENKADAILTKDCGKDELLTIIKSVMDGFRVFGKEASGYIANKVQKNTLIKLTIREKQVLEMLSKGYSRAKVAECLNCKPSAVNFHCKNIFRKFDKKNLVQVLDAARNNGMIV